MNSRKNLYIFGLAGIFFVMTACKSSKIAQTDPELELPASYLVDNSDTVTIADLDWHDYFHDPYLSTLIDSALVNNRELNIIMQEIAIAQNEVLEKKGEYQPSLNVQAGAGVDKVGRYTTHGAFEATTEMEPGKEIPEAVPDYLIGAYATWEIDIWRKLRNSRDAAVKRFLASNEGKNFMVTNLVSEIAGSYYELLALDNEMEIVNQNIEILTNALKIVRMEKEATRVTELAVKKFEAEVLNAKALKFMIKQEIIETENEINFLTGRVPQSVERDPQLFTANSFDSIRVGQPVQLFQNRPDIRRAELELEASKLDVKVARANFYPSLGLSGGIGMNAFNPTYLFNPESMLFSMAGDLVAPLLNRKAIKAQYRTASAKQVQAVLEYERTTLNAYIEVANQISRMNNLKNSLELKEQQVNALTKAISIANNLFKSAHADYMEVLMTQRDALESKFELVELQMQQMHSKVDIYRALGGGWKMNN